VPDIVELLASADADAMAPAVALLQRTPDALERRISLVDRAGAARILPATTMALVDRLVALDGGAPPPAGEMHEVEGIAPRRPAWFSACCLRAWEELGASMLGELGCRPVAASAYRSPTYQALLILWHLHDHAYDVAGVARWVLSPARSEHCLPERHAVDLTTPETNVADQGPPAFATTAEYAWLRERAAAFGFRESYRSADGPIDPEPWHWRYDP
jgi:hypothetical protein